MRFSHFIGRWIGVALTLTGVVSILWLAGTGRLELYIHPRYVIFTVVMAVIGGAVAIAALVVPGTSDEHDEHDEHSHGGHGSRRRGVAIFSGLGGVAVLLCAMVALLVLPPASLTISTAQSKDLTASTASLDSMAAPALVGGDTSAFTVKDWAALLRQGAGMDYFSGKAVDVVGVVVPTDDDDVYYLARFVITHCALDAQPVGVPVHDPGWRDRFGEGAWLELAGRFVENPDAAGVDSVVLVPDTATTIDEPAQPYVF